MNPSGPGQNVSFEKSFELKGTKCAGAGTYSVGIVHRGKCFN